MSPKINDRDLVIVKRTQQWIDGNIIVGVNDGVAIIKKVSREGERFILRSLNEKYHPFVAAEDFRIEGVVRGIISYTKS